MVSVENRDVGQEMVIDTSCFILYFGKESGPWEYTTWMKCNDGIVRIGEGERKNFLMESTTIMDENGYYLSSEWEKHKPGVYSCILSYGAERKERQHMVILPIRLEKEFIIELK
jgi:hypothetical protein